MDETALAAFCGYSGDRAKASDKHRERMRADVPQRAFFSPPGRASVRGRVVIPWQPGEEPVVSPLSEHQRLVIKAFTPRRSRWHNGRGGVRRPAPPLHPLGPTMWPAPSRLD